MASGERIKPTTNERKSARLQRQIPLERGTGVLHSLSNGKEVIIAKDQDLSVPPRFPSRRSESDEGDDSELQRIRELLQRRISPDLMVD